MKTVYLKTATHIHAEPGMHAVSDAECARLCALGVAEPAEEQAPAEEPKAKKAKRRAGK